MSTTPEPEDTGREPGGEVVPFPRQPDGPAGPGHAGQHLGHLV